MADASAYLGIYLEPLASFLARPDVTDIYINEPGAVWLETVTGGVEHHLAPALNEALLGRLARQVASLTHQGISREHPLLAAALPDGSRIQIAAPPATRRSYAIAIRKHVNADLTLDDLEDRSMFAHVRAVDAGDPVEVELKRLYDAGAYKAFLRQAVRARKTIVVSGGTSTGKTTFANALIKEIPADERLIFIEDTPEIKIAHANAVGLLAVRGNLGEASVTTEDLLVASLRMRPDRIILGEIRGAEAFTFLRAVNTGHPGSITTVHADTPERALEQIALQCVHTYQRLSPADMAIYLRSVIDIVIQLCRSPSGRIVSAIFKSKM